MVSALFDLIFKNTSEAVFLVDSTGVVLECNPAACSLLDCAIADIVSQPLEALLKACQCEAHPRITLPFSLKGVSSQATILYPPDQELEGLTHDTLQAIKDHSPWLVSRWVTGQDSEAQTLQNMVDFLGFLTGSPQVNLMVLDATGPSIKNIYTNVTPSKPPSGLNLQEILLKIFTPKFSDHPTGPLSLDGILSQAGETAFSTPILLPEINSLALPIMAQKSLLGILTAEIPSQLPEFSPQDHELVRFFANQAAIYLESRGLHRQLLKQRKQTNTLRELLQLKNTGLDQSSVLEQILDQLGKVIDYDSACIMLIDENKIAIAAHRRFRAREQLEIPLQIDLYPHIQEVLESQQAIIISDTQKDPRWYSLPNTSYIRCWLGVPLIGMNQVIGLLNLDKMEPNYYKEEDAELAMSFANQAAVALENARLYSVERQRASQLDALRSTVAELSAELELSRLLGIILERAIDFLKATGGDLGLFDEEKQEIVIVASHNMGNDYRNTRLALGEGAMGLAVQTHHSIIVDDYEAWHNASSQYKQGPWRAVLAVPFLIGDRIVGVIGIVDQNPRRQFSSTDEQQLNQFAEHAAIAVENAHLFKAAQEAAERMEVLHRVSQQIVAASLDSEGIYTAIHKAAAELMPAEAFALTLLDEATQTIHAVYLIDRSGRIPIQVIPAGSGLSGQVIARGETIYIKDTYDTAESSVIHYGDPEQVRSVVAVPLRLRGKVIGMLSCQSYDPDAFTSEDQHLLEMLASYAAIALENLNLFTEIQKLAITDPGTEIFNRRQLFELGQREFARARRLNRPLSVIMLDIDHFKKVNDTFGHSTGDYVLHKLAQLMKTNTRSIDIVGRYGGEEFVAVLTETNLQTAADTAERLRNTITSGFLHDPKGTPITVSMGVAELLPETVSFSGIIHHADLALYLAKNSGHNQVCVYSPDLVDET